MLTIYVKHYLTPEGIHYFKSRWFPKVCSILSQQNGYLSITCKEVGDCLDITLKFKDEETFDAWAAVPDHDDLTTELDIYRSRDYWEAVRTDDELADPSTLEWTTVKTGF